MSDATHDLPLRESDGQGIVRALFVVYGVMLAAGIVLFRYFGLDSGLTMNFDRSVFWAINALTCTGFRASPNGLQEFSQFGLVIVYVLVLAGAMTAMMVEGILICRYAGLRHSPVQIVAGTCFLMLAASVFGAGMLMSEDRSFGESLFEATNAIANAGMSLREPRGVEDWRLQLVIIPLAAIGGLGIPVVIEVFDRLIVRRPISRYSGRMLRLSALVWLVCFGLLLSAGASLPWRENILSSWAYAINARSLGANIPVAFGRVAWWLVAIFMVVGAAGGSSGGLRLGTLSVLARHGGRAVAGERPGTILGLAVTWVSIFCGLAVMLFILLLSAAPDLPTDRVLLLAAGAIGNTGISLDPVALSPRGLALLSAAMIAGHLLPLQLAAWWVEPIDD